MKNIVVLFVILFSSYGLTQPQFSSMASMPGTFSRFGFGARGIGMGNAMSSVTEGNLVSYYNPALPVFQEGNSFQAGYSFLSIDRSLNFFNFTRKFDFFSKQDTSSERKPRTTAGVSAGIINAGVSNIDGRDNNGLPTGELSTSENQFFIALANRFSEKLSIGIAAKFYYYSLYTKVSSTSLGVDIGAIYRINENFNVSLMVSDINSKYEWDTGPIYDLDGVNSVDKFPLLKKIGVSYRNKDLGLLGALEFENSNAETNILRAGVEYNILGIHPFGNDQFFVRAGIDQFNLSNTDWPVKPSFGLTFLKTFNSFVVGIDYAFVVEQYSSSDRHIVGVNFNF